MLLAPQSLTLCNTDIRPVVAISACLNGDKVRYDGGDKSLQSTLAILSKHLQLQPICPEVGAGMGVPRAPVQLVQGSDGSLRALGRDNPQLDVTEALLAYARSSLQTLQPDICGYILKSRSPSCGLGSTEIIDPDGRRSLGSGLQAAHFARELPWLQRIEETALDDPHLCADFIARCLLLADVRQHCRRHSPEPLRHHYAGLIRRLPETAQAQLDSDDPGRFWQAFGAGLAAAPHYPA